MTEKRQFRLSIISVWVGILIPIVAAVIPFTYKSFWPEHDLVYEIVGPISVKGTKAFSLKIKNQGEKLEKNVKVWVKAEPLFFFKLKDAKSGATETTPDAVKVESTASVNVSKDRDHYVIAVGDLRPRELIELSVLSEAISLLRLSDVQGISIKSDEHLARLLKPSEFEQFLYPAGFWMFVLLMIFIFVAGIYQQYLMDPKKREEMLLKEIDKLGKR